MAIPGLEFDLNGAWVGGGVHFLLDRSCQRLEERVHAHLSRALAAEPEGTKEVLRGNDARLIKPVPCMCCLSGRRRCTWEARDYMTMRIVLVRVRLHAAMST